MLGIKYGARILNRNDGYITFDISSLPKGADFIKYIAGGKTGTAKVMVK